MLLYKLKYKIESSDDDRFSKVIVKDVHAMSAQEALLIASSLVPQANSSVKLSNLILEEVGTTVSDRSIDQKLKEIIDIMFQGYAELGNLKVSEYASAYSKLKEAREYFRSKIRKGDISNYRKKDELPTYPLDLMNSSLFLLQQANSTKFVNTEYLKATSILATLLYELAMLDY